MASLSVSTAWNETAAFVGREGRLLFPIAFLLIALPGALMQVAMPAPVQGQMPEGGLWVLLLPVAVVLGLIGNLAITTLALRPGTSVGEALQHGAKRFLPVLGAVLLVALAAALVMIPIFLVFAGAAVATGGSGLAVIPALLIIPAAVFVWTRLLLLNPVGAAEPVGPVGIIRRSWQLTAGHFWKLLGLLLLLIIAAIVLSIAVGAIGAIIIFLITGPPTPGSVGAYLILIVSALLQAVMTMIFAVLIARIYAQLSPSAPSDVFA